MDGFGGWMGHVMTAASEMKVCLRPSPTAFVIIGNNASSRGVECQSVMEINEDL